MKNLLEALEIKDGDVLTIVGSSGKTTLLFKIGELLKNKKILLTTSTKMYKPKDRDVDFLTLDGFEFYNVKEETLSKTIKAGRSFLYSDLKNGKVSTSIGLIEEVLNDFDVSIIEGDGSKKKLLKGWNENEPVIVKGTTKTIGIIPIRALGLEINSENIHRLDKFSELIDGKSEGKVDIYDIEKIITRTKGLFKDSIGEKILFINCVESKEAFKNAIKIKETLKQSNIDKIIIGSLKEDRYFR